MSAEELVKIAYEAKQFAIQKERESLDAMWNEHRTIERVGANQYRLFHSSPAYMKDVIESSPPGFYDRLFGLTMRVIEEILPRLFENVNFGVTPLPATLITVNDGTQPILAIPQKLKTVITSTDTDENIIARLSVELIDLFEELLRTDHKIVLYYPLIPIKTADQDEYKFLTRYGRIKL
jgi:hypothetical protein